MPMLSSNEDGSKDKGIYTYDITNYLTEFRIKSADISVQWISPSIFFRKMKNQDVMVKKKQNKTKKKQQKTTTTTTTKKKKTKTKIEFRPVKERHS